MCGGVRGVVVAGHGAAGVSAAVAKSAAGAIEHLRMTRVAGLPKALGRLADAGVWSVGLDAGGEAAIHDLTVADEPVALVLGAEGSGLSRLVRERCDTIANIPLGGVLGSLYAAAAAATAQRRTLTPPRIWRGWRGWSQYAGALPCILAAPTNAPCTIWRPRFWITPWTRRWPASPIGLR